MTAIAAAMTLALLATPPSESGTTPPPVNALFDCPLLTEAKGFKPPASWRTHRLPDLGVQVRLPRGWTIERDGRTAMAEAPDGQTWLSLRRGDPGDEAHLDRVRRDVETTELGPSHLAPGCASRLSERLKQLAGWSTLRLSVTRRALAQRRRAYAMFAPVKGGTLIAVLTAKWRREGATPLPLIRQLLTGLRAL